MLHDASLRDFPRLPAERDDAPRFQRAIDACPDGVLAVPRGIYEIGAPLFIRNRCSLDMHPAAVLRAVAPMDFVLTYDGGESFRNLIADSDPLNVFLRGGDLDGAGMASCLAVYNYHHFTLSNMVLHNGRTYGFRTSRRGGFGYELIATNVYAKCTMSGNTGFYTDLCDSHYTDCIVVDYTVGFGSYGGANRFTRCHVWGGILPPVGVSQEDWMRTYRARRFDPASDPAAWRAESLPEMLVDSVCFDVHGACLFDGCFADTGEIGFRIAGGSVLTGCRVYNNYRFGMDHMVAIDHLSGALTVSNSRFDAWHTPHPVLYRHAADTTPTVRDCQVIRFPDGFPAPAVRA